MVSRADLARIAYAQRERQQFPNMEVILWDAPFPSEMGVKSPGAAIAHEELRGPTLIMLPSKMISEMTRVARTEVTDTEGMFVPSWYIWYPHEHGKVNIVGQYLMIGGETHDMALRGTPWANDMQHSVYDFAVTRGPETWQASDPITWREMGAVADVIRWMVEHPHMFPLAAGAPRLNRGAEKALRRKHGMSPSDIKVIELRPRERREKAAAEASGRTYQFQWDVRGHWRTYPVNEHREKPLTVWIAPYVKGPKGAPKLARMEVKKF